MFSVGQPFSLVIILGAVFIWTRVAEGKVDTEKFTEQDRQAVVDWAKKKNKKFIVTKKPEPVHYKKEKKKRDNKYENPFWNFGQGGAYKQLQHVARRYNFALADPASKSKTIDTSFFTPSSYSPKSKGSWSAGSNFFTPAGGGGGWGGGQWMPPNSYAPHWGGSGMMSPPVPYGYGGMGMGMGMPMPNYGTGYGGYGPFGFGYPGAYSGFNYGGGYPNMFENYLLGDWELGDGEDDPWWLEE